MPLEKYHYIFLYNNMLMNIVILLPKIDCVRKIDAGLGPIKKDSRSTVRIPEGPDRGRQGDLLACRKGNSAEET